MAKKKLSSPVKKKTSRKNLYLYGGIGAVVLIMATFIFSSGPRQGSLFYGVCATFLELHVQHPKTIEHKIVEQYARAIRIYFTHIDSFGQRRLQFIECSVKQDAQRGTLIDKVLIDRQPVEQEKVEAFNGSLNVFGEYQPDLTLPRNRRSDVFVQF